MRSYQENYVQAFQAVLYVMSKMTIGSPNNIGADAAKTFVREPNPAGLVRGFTKIAHGQIANKIRRDLRAKQDQFERDLYKSGKFAGDAYKELCWAELARAATAAGVGNCAEQAAIAFMYLRDRGLFPIDLVEWGNSVGHIGGHAFVILDRPAESDITKPDTWGGNCVVCDPHQENTAFPASMVKHYFGDKPFELSFRMERPSSVTVSVPAP